MRFQTGTSPHIAPRNTVARVMRRVLCATLPGVAVMIGFFGWGVLITIAIASIVAVAAEAALLTVRDKPLKLYLGDFSALVTGWLLGIALPPLSPWWLTALAAGFAIVVAKHLYGGLGQNLFNPAMVGYVVVLIAFPLEMSSWAPADGLFAGAMGFSDALRVILIGQLPSGVAADAISGATPLDYLRTQLELGRDMAEIGTGTALLGNVAGKGWEWVSAAFMAGGLWLVAVRTAAWQIPAAMLATLTLSASLFYAIDPATYTSPWFHLFSGAAIFGAFFIATDPVTASTTPRGRLIYGAGIGVLTYIIRTFGGYPEGVAFAVLLMNIAAPTIDYYTRPRVFGARQG